MREILFRGKRVDNGDRSNRQLTTEGLKWLGRRLNITIKEERD